MLRASPQKATEQPFRYQARRKLLIIDDNLDDRMRYFEAFSRAGYDVHCVSSFTSSATPPANESFDLILVSESIPYFSGGSILARVVLYYRQTPVLVLDRYADSTRYLEAMSAGAHDYLEKPLHPSDIVALVASYLPVTDRHLGKRQAH